MKTNLFSTTCTICFTLTIFFSSFAQAGQPCVEVSTSKKTVEGRKITHDRTSCLMMTRSGQIETVRINDVTGFRFISESFQPYTAVELRSRLRKEFDDYSFDIKGNSHYLVVANEGYAEEYAELFDQIYREFRMHFSVRGFNMPQPEFPLVAIVFPQREQFAKYAANDGIPNISGLAGYYDRRTNRVALFDPQTELASRENNPTTKTPVTAVARATVSDDLQATIVHEATHQIAFNVGLHSRTGEMPKWIVEGLATVFEHPDMRGPAQQREAKHRVNRERYVWFGNYLKSRHTEGAMANLVASDASFSSHTLDAYAKSWAFSFFLMERYGSEYSKYLARIAARVPGQAYPAKERLSDFEACFGKSVEQMEIDFLRFFEKL